MTALTNFQPGPLPPDSAEPTPFLELFRGVTVSGDARMVKPDPAILRIMTRSFALKPALRCLRTQKISSPLALPGMQSYSLRRSFGGLKASTVSGRVTVRKLHAARASRKASIGLSRPSAS